MDETPDEVQKGLLLEGREYKAREAKCLGPGRWQNVRGFVVNTVNTCARSM